MPEIKTPKMEERNGPKYLNTLISLVGGILLAASLYFSVNLDAKPYVPRYKVREYFNNSFLHRDVPFTFPDGSGGGAIELTKGSKLEEAFREGDQIKLDTLVEEYIRREMKKSGTGVKVIEEDE